MRDKGETLRKERRRMAIADKLAVGRQQERTKSRMKLEKGGSIIKYKTKTIYRKTEKNITN